MSSSWSTRVRLRRHRHRAIYGVAVATGRRLIEDALREPMQSIGWQRRGAGWFTMQVADGYLGVIAIGVATKHAEPGSAFATLYVGLRDEPTERLVAHLCSVKDERYRARTAVTSIGYLMRRRRWREWLVTPETAAAVAATLSSAVRKYAQPYLHRLAQDPQALITAAQDSPGYVTSVGGCGVAVLLARHRSTDDAFAFVDNRMAALGERRDDAAHAERAWAAAFRGWANDPVSRAAPQ